MAETVALLDPVATHHNLDRGRLHAPEKVVDVVITDECKSLRGVGVKASIMACRFPSPLSDQTPPVSAS